MLAIRCYARFTSLQEFEKAVTYYDKALTNHRFKEYLNGKQACQKAQKEAERLAYIDPEAANEAKVEAGFDSPPPLPLTVLAHSLRIHRMRLRA